MRHDLSFHWNKYQGSRRHMRNTSDEVIFFFFPFAIISNVCYSCKNHRRRVNRPLQFKTITTTTTANRQTRLFLYRILRPTETPFVRRNFPIFTCKKKKKRRRTSPESPSNRQTLSYCPGMRRCPKKQKQKIFPRTLKIIIIILGIMIKNK